MTIQERIKQFRKEQVELTQEEFANRINISRSNFANIEKGSVNLTDRVIADICRVFSVSREWLIEGVEPVYLQKNSETANEITKIYNELNDDSKKYLKGYIHRLIEEQNQKE